MRDLAHLDECSKRNALPNNQLGLTKENLEHLNQLAGRLAGGCRSAGERKSREKGSRSLGREDAAATS